MKQTIKFNRNLFTLSFLFIAFAFVSCEKDEMQDDLSLDKRGGATTATVYGSISYSSSEICHGDSVTVTFDNEQGQDHGNFQLHVWGPNDLDWVNVNGALSAPSNGKVTYTFEPEFIGDYNFRGQWVRNGNPNDFPGESTGWILATTPLAVISCCVNNLEADLVCGTTNTLSLSFTAEEDGAIVIQGGLTNGTTIVSSSSNVLVENTTHPSVTNSNANVTRWEGDVTACDEVTITIEFTGGNGVGDWSAKRGDDVLGATEAISCQ
jgi:hypothetical protein